MSELWYKVFPILDFDGQVGVRFAVPDTPGNEEFLRFMHGVTSLCTYDLSAKYGIFSVNSSDVTLLDEPADMIAWKPIQGIVVQSSSINMTELCQQVREVDMMRCRLVAVADLLGTCVLHGRTVPIVLEEIADNKDADERRIASRLSPRRARLLALPMLREMLRDARWVSSRMGALPEEPPKPAWT